MAWTGPSTNAPGGNTAAPINVGGTLQEKMGPLIINSSTSSPASSGLYAFGTSTFFGKVLSEEDFCYTGSGNVYGCLKPNLDNLYRAYFAIQNQGEACTDVVSTATCGTWSCDFSTNPNCTGANRYCTSYTTGSGTTYKELALPMYCKNGRVCNIIQTISTPSGLGGLAVRHRVVNFSQTGSGYWWSSDTTGGALINGDSTSSNVVTSQNTDTLMIRDDRTGTENSFDAVTLIDSNSGHHMDVKICSAMSPDIDMYPPVPVYNNTTPAQVTCPANYQKNQFDNCVYCPSPSTLDGFGNCQVQL